MAKLIQNSFVTPQNLIQDSQFLRGGGYASNYFIGTVTTRAVQILPGWTMYVATPKGRAENVRVRRGRGELRISGRILSGCSLTLYYKQIFSESGETIEERPNTYLTFGASVTDNLGNLEPKSRMYITTYGEYDSSTINFYYRKNSALSAKEKVNGVACFVSNMRFSPAIGIYLGSDAYTGRYIDFDISITDVYLYEGLYTGAKPSMDWASLTGIGLSYLNPKDIETFMLPEHLPQHAREIEFDGSRIQSLYTENPTCLWVAVMISQMGSTNVGAQQICKGSLYFVPNGQATNAFRKYDMFYWRRRISNGWQTMKNTFTIDSSYSAATSDFEAKFEPNPEAVIDTVGNVSTISFRFKRSAQNDQQYGKFRIFFVPEVYKDGYGVYWTHIIESNYKLVFH